MKFTDYKQIDKIEFLYPELMSKDAKERVRKIHEQIQLSTDLLAEMTISCEDLRKQIAALEKEWELLTPLMKVTYGVVEKEEVRGEINLGFNFGTEINKHIH